MAVYRCIHLTVVMRMSLWIDHMQIYSSLVDLCWPSVATAFAKCAMSTEQQLQNDANKLRVYFLKLIT
jgi:hypothetical protein